MAMQTDVKAKNLTTSGAASVGPTRIRGVYFVNASQAGSVSIKEGGSSGTELVKIDAPANTSGTGATYVLFPGNGVWFKADPYVTLTQVGSVTFFYG